MSDEQMYTLVYKKLGVCGCGSPEDGLNLLIEVLRCMPLYEKENQTKFMALIGGDAYSGIGQIVLWLLDKAELIEHGSSIGGSWITDEGRSFLKYFEAATAEEFFNILGFDEQGNAVREC